MAKSRKSHSSKHKKSQKKCGGDASDWVKQVVGDYPHHPQEGLGNVIPQHVPAANITMHGGFSGSDILNPGNSVHESIAGAPGPASMAGGRKKDRHCKRKGGNVISEIAVPAVLLVANQAFRKKTGKKSPFFSRRSRNRRFSRRR
jgi:hypothetical protein